MSRKVSGPMVNDKLLAKRGDKTMVVIGSMKREFDDDNVDVLADSKEEEQVVM